VDGADKEGTIRKPGKGKKKITKLLSFSLVSNLTYVFFSYPRSSAPIRSFSLLFPAKAKKSPPLRGAGRADVCVNGEFRR
jgi:hypothetical protein